MNPPTATYRLQLGPEFGFAQCREVLPYLKDLGISHVYASPIFQARPGSPHGYDVVDPNTLGAELGGAEAWTALVEALRRHGIGWLQDIVPNHMAYDAANPMLADLLENGPAAALADSFDIFWDHPDESLQGRVLAPFLARRYSACLAAGELRMAYDADGFYLKYGSLRFPLRIDTYLDVLDPGRTPVDLAAGADARHAAAWADLRDRLERLPLEARPTLRSPQAGAVKRILWELYGSSRAVRAHVNDSLARFNPPAGVLDRFAALDALLAGQWFRLSRWQDANDAINYRRFFDINELIGLRQENEAVFHRTHALVVRLAAEGVVAGVRVDHIDGLADPLQYLQRLRACLGEEHTILVEKVLAPEEDLPSEWPVQGTTGYDFAHWVNNLFVRREHADRFDAIYGRFGNAAEPFRRVVVASKRRILASRLAGDLDNLAERIRAVSANMRFSDNLIRARLASALVEVLARLPVYRTYIRDGAVSPADRHILESCLSRARRARPDLGDEIDFIGRILLQPPPAAASGDGASLGALHRLAVRGFQQLSAALTAKGFEDTALYRYHRLLSLNEVGSDPDRFGCRVDRFHDFMTRRAAEWPHAMNTTATHDAKRGEDVRARLNVLSELPDEWEAQLRVWRALVRDHRTRVRGRRVPDANTAYLLFQTLIGVWPPEKAVTGGFIRRIQSYMRKAAREDGRQTSWIAPKEDYEAALDAFIGAVVDASAPAAFPAAFLPFCRRIAFFGRFNSLSQCLLKIIAPGVPDFYQGTELMQLDLVDPDNRRPVDFSLRRRLLDALERRRRGQTAPADDLLAEGHPGKIKQFLIARALECRRNHRRLFETGAYLPLQAGGRFRDHIVAFARRAETSWCIALAPRFLTELVEAPHAPVGTAVWGDTWVDLPAEAPSSWRNVLTGRHLQANGKLRAGDAMSEFPLALLQAGASA